MESLKKPGTTKSPTVEFSIDGNFFISGNSYMEDPYGFYTELSDWISQFLKRNMNEICLNISLKFVNTSSIKYLFNLISAMHTHSFVKTKVVWEFDAEDEDMLEMGEELQRLTQMEFEFKEK